MTTNRSITLAISSILAAGALVGCKSEGDKPCTTEKAAVTEPAKPLTVERKIEGSMHAKVRAIDYTTRQITLADEREQSLTFTAGPQVRRFNEVRVGDMVNAAYTATLTAELRPPTAEESANPIAAAHVSGRADRSSDPAAAAVLGVRVVTTVQAIDIPNMRVTLRGPMGDQVTVRARSEENIKKLKINDTIVLTYVEGVAISVDKADR